MHRVPPLPKHHKWLVTASVTSRLSTMIHGSNFIVRHLRRRRKRSRSQPSKGRQRLQSVDNKLIYDVHDYLSIQAQSAQKYDEDTLAFLDRDGDLLADRKPQFGSLPILLESRRSGRWSSGSNIPKMQPQWQSNMLFNVTKKPIDPSIGRRQWRPYAHRTIPFTRLGTPPSDAVLAMDRTGSYVLSLGSTDGDQNDPRATPGLALRFYGIPNRNNTDSNHQRQHVQRHRATLLQCVPLLHAVGNLEGGQQDSNRVAGNAIFNFQGDVTPGSTPVKLLISKDWRLGVALLRRRVFDGATGESQTETTGTMVIFTLPRRRCDTLTLFTCPNVEMAISQDHSRNLLWLVHAIPCDQIVTSSHVASACFRNYASVPGYLIFNDEGDGYRMTWCTAQNFLSDNTCQVNVATNGSPLKNSLLTAVPILTRQQSWERSLCDGVTGSTIPLSHTTATPPDQVSVIYEAYLRIDLLLADILSRRKGFTKTRPELFFAVISMHNAGRVVNVVITFARPKKACSIGIFVNIDLFTGRYEELDWVIDSSNNATSVQTWCNRLAINRRMKHLRTGPYASGEKINVDWSCLVTDTNAIDYDEGDNYDERFWRNLMVEKTCRRAKCRSFSKVITLSSLYPDCDIVSNEALIRCEPVKLMRSKDAPLQLIYE
jgi:hypothetical protein